jgi:hypothetical protein
MKRVARLDGIKLNFTSQTQSIFASQKQPFVMVFLENLAGSVLLSWGKGFT